MSHPSAPPPVPLRQLIGPVYVPMFLLATGLSASFPGFPGYVSGLGAGLTMVGVMVSLLGLGNILADLPAGFLIHRFGDRRLIIISSALAGIAAFGIAASANLGVIGILRTIIGLSHSTMLMSMMTFVRHNVPTAARGRSLAFVGGALRLGFLLGPVVGGVLAETLGMPAVFLLQGALMVVSTLFLVSTGQDSTTATGRAPVSPPAIPAGGDQRGGPLRELLRNRGRDLSVVALVVFTLMFLRQAR
ncbi:MAG: MFS transporter, partial [Spirochaetota bacterium]